MMLMALLSTGIALILFALLFWLLFRPLATQQDAATLVDHLKLEDLSPLHCRHFPQIRQALSSADEDFLRRRASRRALLTWRAERRRALQSFLYGLGEDFSRLVRLARAVAALSPEIDRAREVEQLWLALRFRGLYRLVALRLMLGSASVTELARLTQLIGSFAAQIEAGMASLEKDSAPGLRTRFSV